MGLQLEEKTREYKRELAVQPSGKILPLVTFWCHGFERLFPALQFPARWPNMAVNALSKAASAMSAQSWTSRRQRQRELVDELVALRKEVAALRKLVAAQAKNKDHATS